MNDFEIMQEDVERVAKTFRAFGDRLGERQKAIAEMGAGLFAPIAASSAPRGTVPHKRYSNGKVVATYSPGNLQRSMQVLNFRRSSSAWVGAKLKGGGKGNFTSEKKADGYYMHMVERGTAKWPEGKPFFNSAWNRSKPMVYKLMADQFRREAERFMAENGLT